jgi:hypothetical protein
MLTGVLEHMTMEPEKFALMTLTCVLFHTRRVPCVGEGEDAGIGVGWE